MTDAPLSIPHIANPEDAELFRILDEVRTSKIGTYLLERAESQKVIFERKDLPARIQSLFMPAKGRKPARIQICPKARGEDVVYILEMARQDSLFPAKEIGRKAPVAALFSCIAREAIATVALALHTQGEPVLVKRGGGKLTPKEESALRKHMEQEHPEQMRAMRLNFCFNAYSAGMVSDVSAKRGLREYRKYAHARRYIGTNTDITGLLYLGAGGFLLYTTGGDALMTTVALSGPSVLVGWNAVEYSWRFSEIETVSLRKAHDEIYKMAELPQDWGNYLLSVPPLATTEGKHKYETREFALALLNKHQRAYFERLTKSANRSPLLNAGRKVRNAAWALTQ